MRSLPSRSVRSIGVLLALLAARPASGAWSGDCTPPSPEPALSALGTIVGQALAAPAATQPRPSLSAPTVAAAPALPAVRGPLLKVTSSSPNLDVPPAVQDGPKCGFYAMAMVIARAYRSPMGEAAVIAERMFEKAVAGGVTTDGSMSMQGLAETARASGYRVHVTRDATVDDLVASLERDVPPVVLIVVENDPKSSNLGGPRATESKTENLGHYVVIERVFTDQHGKRWVVAQHGWREKPYIWSEEAFTTSWKLRKSQTLEIEPPLKDMQGATP